MKTPSSDYVVRYVKTVLEDHVCIKFKYKCRDDKKDS